MRAERVFGVTALLVYGALAACSIENRRQSELQTAGGSVSGAGGQAGRGGHGGRGGAAGRAGARAGGAPGMAEEAGAAGEAGAVSGGAAAGEERDSGLVEVAGEGDASSTRDSGPPSELMPGCTADAGCSALPTCHSGTVKCSVVPFDVYCELSLAVGHSASVACGEAVTVDNESCGACGPVAIEVYYDGTYCWQGVPGCPIEGLAGKFIVPHLPDPE